MAGNAILREVALTLPMEPDIEIEASRAATAVAESMEMSPDKIDEIRMAVVEACINALEHSRAQEERVHLIFEVMGEDEPESLRITVKDRGIGFEPEEIEEPTIEDKLKAASKRGWGLKIIRGLMDEVEILSSAEGTALVMWKSR